MRQTLGNADGVRLERSWRPVTASIRFWPAADGLELADAFFSSGGFHPHRHDTYGIGMTMSGVQTFRYRGEDRVCLPGQLHILHPDEEHDGRAGSDEGFGYRILYIAPALIQRALPGRELPFIPDPVQNCTSTTHPLATLLSEAGEPISDLARVDMAATIADTLGALSGRSDHRRAVIDPRAVDRVREYLAAHAREQTPAATLEAISGLDRFTLARHFRRAFGTSPDRYRTMRRLALARKAIEGGLPLAAVAADSGFADQSHLTRQFKRTYGLTPSRWAKALAPPA